MELMSSLLLYAVVAFPPLALAESTIKYAEYGSIRKNSSINSRPIMTNNLLGIRPSLLKIRFDLLSPFMDRTCKHCMDCMERAVKDFKSKTRLANTRPGTEDFPEEILTIYNEVPRRKRESDMVIATKPEEIALKTKRWKSKKNKINKTVTVTKYNVDRQIIALKVKEAQVLAEQDDTLATTTCQVYSVNKSYPCDTPESDSIIAAARRKVNKKNKKEKDKSKMTMSTEATKFIASAFRKREVDNSQIPENVMPSIEEMY